VEQFAAHGRAYQWHEGAGLIVADDTASKPSRRNSLAAFFSHKLVAQLERRGARGLIFAAAASDGSDARDVQWITWRAPTDTNPVWGLYLAASKLDGRSPSAANDTMVLIAWGDGLALAWADEREPARLALRAALRVPPTWLARGLRSADPTFPVRIEPADDEDDRHPRNAGARCVALMPPIARRESNNRAAAPEVLLGMLKEWKRTHARESTG
jgi:hypothetical protein